EAFEQALTLVTDDGFALAGLVEASRDTGDRDKEADARSRLLNVWSHADHDLQWLKRVNALGDSAARRAESSRGLESAADGEQAGLWQPYEAPGLDARDIAGKPVSLQTYRGKSVLLVFSLGETCAPCVRQLLKLKKRIADVRRLDTEVLVIDGDSRA